MTARLYNFTAGLSKLPTWRRYLYGGILLAVLIYLAWSKWWPRPQLPVAGFVAAKPAVSAKKVDGPLLKVPLRIVPKESVKRKFPEAHIDDPKDEVIDTADIDPAPNGAITITTVDTQTGEAKTEVKMKEAPWFALERQNYLGLRYELHTDGSQKVKIYLKRDLFRIKDAHAQAEAQLRAPINGSGGQVEGYVGGNAEYRFMGW